MEINGNQVYVMRDTRNPNTKRRLIEIHYEPIRYHDIETNEWFNEWAINNEFRYWSQEPYVTPKERALRIAGRVAKCPLRILLVVTYIFVLPTWLLMVLSIPLQWLIYGDYCKFNPLDFFKFINHVWEL